MSETNRTRSQQERESRLHMGTPGGKQTGGRSGLHCDHRDWSTPTSHRRHPARHQHPGWGRCLDLLACPQKGSHPSLCRPGPGQPRGRVPLGRRGRTGAQGSPQSRAGLEDGDRSRASGPASWCARACPCASVGVCLPHVHDKLRTGCLYKTSRSRRILFILLSRACPWPSPCAGIGKPFLGSTQVPRLPLNEVP